jgi:hypothetical protein
MDILRFDKFINEKLYLYRNEYELNPKYCLQCGKELPYEKRNNTYCDQSCSGSHSQLGIPKSDASNKARSETLKIVEYRVCELCKGEYLRRFYKQRFCCKDCSDSHNLNISHLNYLRKKVDNPDWWSDRMKIMWADNKRDPSGGWTEILPYTRSDKK